MEVHHHPQLEHKPKPWKEYLLEFLMIFLAVTMGFFAESLRERIADREKENQYIQSLAEDLKDDVKTIDIEIGHEKKAAVMLDSLIYLLNKPADVGRHGDDLYYFGRLGPRLRNLTVNMRTFEQLKNAGNFRLISDVGVSNKITSYYEKVAYIKQLEDIFMGEFVDYKQIAAKVFDPGVLRKHEDGMGGIILSNDNPSLQKDASQYLKQLAVFTVYMNGSRRGIIAADGELLNSARELLSYLQKEYRLEDK